MNNEFVELYMEVYAEEHGNWIKQYVGEGEGILQATTIEEAIEEVEELFNYDDWFNEPTYYQLAIVQRTETTTDTVWSEQYSPSPERIERQYEDYDELYEVEDEFSTTKLLERDGEYYLLTKNGGSLGAYDRMTNIGWIEQYEEPKPISQDEAHEWLRSKKIKLL